MFGQNEPAALILRCKENSTNVYFASSTMLGDSIIADSQTVTYRMDDRRAVNSNWNLSTDRKAAGLWSGQSAIPFLKQILGTRQLFLRMDPHLGNRIEAQFDVSGLERAIGPLRTACGW
jgi:type VI secretion system protein VasI